MESIASISREYAAVASFHRAKVHGALDDHFGDVDEAMNSLDLFPRVAEWPLRYRRLFHMPYLNNPDRFTLFMFFVSNGLDPLWAKTIILEFRNQTLDRAGEDQMNWLIAQARSGRLFKNYSSYTFKE